MKCSINKIVHFHGIQGKARQWLLIFDDAVIQLCRSRNYAMRSSCLVNRLLTKA